LFDALRMNINEHFIRISFQSLDGAGLHFRFIMRSVGKLEEELVDDIAAEFEARHTPDELKKVEIILEDSVVARDLEHLVFARRP
jgi:hypothetical protein